MVPDQVANQSFTTEQKEYLRGFFAGVAQRGAVPFAGSTAFGLITADPASGLPNQAAEQEELYFGTPISELCREEIWKHEENALDIWDKLVAHAAENKAPAPDDLFRFKFHGLFYVSPAQDSFMLRLRVPGSILTTRQLRGLAELAAECGSGRVDITTRSNLQIREFQPKDIIRVLTRMQALGMTSRGSGADNIRNITASPITGIDPDELLDVAPLAEALNTYILNSRDMYGLPRKFNVAFDNGGAISVVADTNDIGFLAVRTSTGIAQTSRAKCRPRRRIYFLRVALWNHRPQAVRQRLRGAAAPRSNRSRRSRHDSRLQSEREPQRPQEGPPQISRRPVGRREVHRRNRKETRLPADPLSRPGLRTAHVH